MSDDEARMTAAADCAIIAALPNSRANVDFPDVARSRDCSRTRLRYAPITPRASIRASSSLMPSASASALRLHLLVNRSSSSRSDSN